ncbi:BTAD domain-containing putative transcriptional regulator [Paractinoplanes lichenicola]|uniref:AfsR/SARP family transcriptional regulator n=1 Tax=Paractinoplanes lichenicola TaxID=2802976 RepID=A0ABS1VVY2_9ACTN|nr:BTAD domain-containing putative transcriptional regulator [Actinoplanes lichenicola]MBL7258645.1 AfsR/SARP family transcriptional regulator [Actinoplanes lichenicola]
MGEHGASGTRLRVTLLGAFEVRAGDTVVPVPGARLRGLLVRLALAGGRAVEPAVLVGTLWPGERPADPANSLQSLVSRLRRMLGAASLVVQNEAGYHLTVAPDDVDALRFERLAAEGRGCLRAGEASQAVRVLGEALELWTGPPVTHDKTRLETIRAEAIADLAEAELALRQPAGAAARLTALLAEDPVHERAAALLMDALAAQGRQAEALALFETVREALADRLGADPGAALRERHVRLLRAEPAAAAPEPVRDHRSNLPEPLTSFIGRDHDLARIDGLLATGRLVTVLGPGGAGKTRLAIEAARRRRHEFRDGVWLVDLAAVTEPAKVGAALLTSAGLRGGALFEPAARIRAEAGDIDVLVEHLDGRETLLVVDNCEHLIDAVAHLIASLLPRCSGIRVLATSREPLAVDGEALVPLGPLTLPGPDDTVQEARRTASVRLFAERAAAVRPGFDVDESTLDDIRRITTALDGMPLALELAAARLRTMSLAELTAGLSDRFRLLTTGNRTAAPRHRTLRSVIAWSWDLLGDHERTVAERVSVLPGGVTPATAIAVCAGTSVPAAEVPDLLAALVDRSLLQLAPDPGRYRMLETLREYGTERLAEQGVLEQTRGLAARHLAALMARLDPELRGPGQVGALRVLGPEYDNMLAGLRYLCDIGDGDAAIALALDLAWYWQMFGRHNEAAYWIGEALAQPPGRPSLRRDCAEALQLLNRISTRSLMTADEIHRRETEMRALADRLTSYPDLPGLMGAMAGMTLFFVREDEAALTLLGRLADGPDVWTAGLAHLIRAQFAENEGNLAQVRIDLTAALDFFGRAGDRWGVATALPMRAMLRQYDGDLDGALDDLRQARALAREFGSLSLTDEIFIDLRWIDLHMRRGDDDLAIGMLDATRERMARSSAPELTLLLNALESGLWIRFGDLGRAGRLLDRAEAEMATQPDLGGDHGRAIAGAMRAALCLELGDADGAEKALVHAYAAGLETRDMPILSLVAVTAAGLAELRDQPHEAARLLGAAARLRGAHDRTDPRIREMTSRGRQALGADGFDEAYGEGWSLDGKTASVEVGRFTPRIDPSPGR